MKQITRILHVDDDADIQMVTRVALESIGGFEVACCLSGEEAVRKAADYVPDLILLDVMMPGMDGPATLRELKKIEEAAEIPIIFMTAKVQTHEIEEYNDLGAIGVVVKPFDPVALCDDIRAIWERHHAA